MIGSQLSPYKNFVYSIQSEFTKKLYVKHLKNYVRYRFSVYEDEQDCDKLLQGDPRLIQSQIIEYFIYLKEERKLTSASIRSITSGLHRFYEMNDMELRWKKIYSYAGQIKKKGKDRPYTKEEISRFLEKADQRERVIILLMCSTGMRIGGLPTLKIRNLENVEKYNIYQITVYENDNEEYTTLCTPECKRAIDSYLEYRKRQGELLKDDAPLIREEFDITDELHIANPRPISVETLRGIIKRLGAMSGVIEKRAQIKDDNNNNKKIERRPVMGTHGFRKFFEATASINEVLCT
jgi:integrase